MKYKRIIVLFWTCGIREVEIHLFVFEPIIILIIISPYLEPVATNDHDLISWYIHHRH